MKCVLMLLLVGCAAEVGPPSPVAPRIECTSDTPPLAIGRCVDMNTGDQCRGAVSEAPQFVELGTEASLDVVRGPQGSSMFVVALRTTGIEPGDSEHPLGPESPLVEIDVRDSDGEEMSRLRRRSAFLPEPGIEDGFFNAGFFVVVDGPCPSGRSLVADVALTDREGSQRCGVLEFTADCEL